MLGYESERRANACATLKRTLVAIAETHQRLSETIAKQDFRDVEGEWRRKDGKIITVKMTGIQSWKR